MTKYTKQAILELALAIAISMSVGLTMAASVTLFGLSNVIITLGIAVFLFCSYKFVKIQSEINERIDQLKNK